MTPKQATERKRGHVVHLRRKDDVTDISVSVDGVREKAEVAEHPSDVNKADDRQGHPLQLAPGAVAQNWNEQDECDSEHRHRDEKSIPARAGVISARGGH